MTVDDADALIEVAGNKQSAGGFVLFDGPDRVRLVEPLNSSAPPRTTC